MIVLMAFFALELNMLINLSSKGFARFSHILMSTFHKFNQVNNVTDFTGN